MPKGCQRFLPWHITSAQIAKAVRACPTEACPAVFDVNALDSFTEQFDPVGGILLIAHQVAYIQINPEAIAVKRVDKFDELGRRIEQPVPHILET